MASLKSLQVQVLSSQRGIPILLIDNFKYSLHGKLVSEEKKRRFRKEKSKAYVFTVGVDNIVTKINVCHNHPACKASVNKNIF